MDVEANDRWQQELDGVRKQYMDWQTRESKNAWQKEQKVMYDAQKPGRKTETPARKTLASETAWEGWRDQSGFTKLETADMASQGSLGYMEADDDGVGGLEAAQARCQQFFRWTDTAEQIFREVGVKSPYRPMRQKPYINSGRISASRLRSERAGPSTERTGSSD